MIVDCVIFFSDRIARCGGYFRHFDLKLTLESRLHSHLKAGSMHLDAKVMVERHLVDKLL